MKIALGSDHAGYAYKERIKEHLCSLGYQPVDFGTFAPSPDVDYPDFIRPAARAVACAQCERGIVLGGSGNGEAMAANRFRGVRCALCYDVRTAELARLHNDANMISLGSRMNEIDTVLAIVDTWLDTPFEGGRHEARVRKIDDPVDEPC
jgi:ribose 5-phosphate isomerase B